MDNVTANDLNGEVCDGFLCCLSRFCAENHGGCSITVSGADGAFPQVFSFPCADGGGAWYELDGAVTLSDGAALRLNADREVYAVYVSPDGEEMYGTIGDSEDPVLADNFPLGTGEEFLFYENPETEEFYV
jgi:hypothetical protein